MRVTELFEQDANLRDEILKVAPRNLAAMASGEAPILYRGMGVDFHRSVGVYRGLTGYHIAARRERRDSKTGLGMLMNYVDTAAAWKKFPKRGLSMSTTPVASHAEIFAPGGVGIIIPFDNVTAFGETPSDFNMRQLGRDRITTRMREASVIILDARRIASRAQAAIHSMDDVSPAKQIAALLAVIRLLAGLDIADRKFSSADDVQLDPNRIQILSDAIAAIVRGMRDPVIIAGTVPGQGGPAPILNVIDLIAELIDTCEDFTKVFGPSLADWFTENITPAKFEAKVHRNITTLAPPTESPGEVWFSGDSILIIADRNVGLSNPATARKLLAQLKAAS